MTVGAVLDIQYKATPTGRLMHLSDKFLRTIVGPIGSGKSVLCCIEILRKAIAQEPHLGIRRTRWVIIRNTYRELIDTTMRTWFDWIPAELGLMRKQDMEFVMKFQLPDGSICYCEILFRALDRPNDIKKLLSLELTGGWINEVREIPKAVLDMLVGRVGRYPSKRQGGPTWWGVIMDTNPPDTDHWYYGMFEEDLPKNAAIFHQPSGLSDEAENIEYLPRDYYVNMMMGKDIEWIKVYVHGEYGFVTDGEPVHPEFHDSVHVTAEPLEWDEESVIFVGVDFGRTPAAVFLQERSGQMQAFDELTTVGFNTTRFAQLLRERIQGHYRKAELVITCDPAGENPGEQIDDTSIQILQNAGLPADAAHTNKFVIRRESVSIPLVQLNILGEPQLIVSPSCTMLRKGLNGGYRYKRLNVGGTTEEFKKQPDKNKYSHICEALHYGMMGAGKGYDVISGHSDVSQFKVIGALDARRKRKEITQVI